jgi:glutaredoxin 3
MWPSQAIGGKLAGDGDRQVEISERQAEITVYTTEPCARCGRAKELLAGYGLSYREVNLAKDPVGRRKLVELTGHMTFPQIVIDGQPLGGFKELVEADGRGELEQLVAA